MGDSFEYPIWVLKSVVDDVGAYLGTWGWDLGFVGIEPGREGLILVVLFGLIVIELDSGFVDDATEGVIEFGQRLNRNHDGVAASADILRNFDKLSAIILLQIDEEHLAIGDDFLAVEGWLVLLS